MQRRELRLLARDRTFLVQTLVFPALIVGMQFFFNAGAGLSLGLIAEPLHLAAIAFALAAYGLMFSAFQALNAEGQALWILYSVPHPLESVLLQKARLWAAITLVYPLALFTVAIAVTGSVSLQLAGAALIVLAGVPIFSLDGDRIGSVRLRPARAGDSSSRTADLHVSLHAACLALCLRNLCGRYFRKSRDRHPDGPRRNGAVAEGARPVRLPARSSASPPPRVSLADGLIAALLFFVLQGLAALTQMRLSGTSSLTPQMLWIAFIAAGAMTYGLMRLVYWRARTADVPRVLGDARARCVAAGRACRRDRLPCGARLASLRSGARSAAPRPGPDSELAGLAIIAIAAAPVFEEFIFRGLIFQGLRRSFGLAAATLASAAIFALVHPVHAMVPVFVMGALAALVYERTKMLAAPMTVHAIYNAVVVGWQWNAI